MQRDLAVDAAPASAKFDTWSATTERVMTRVQIEQLMADTPDTIVRMKGIVRLDDPSPHMVALHRVGQRWSLTPLTEEQQDRTTRLVAIGLVGAVPPDWLAGIFDA